MNKSITFLGFQIDTYSGIIIMSAVCLILPLISFEVGAHFGQVLAR
jgi:hypothetical protein